MPLATAMTLNYMSSVWIAAFLVGGALLAWVPVPGRDGRVPRPPLQGLLVLTVLAGFGGVVLMLKPTVDDNQGFAGLMGLLSGLAAAFAYMQVVALSRLGEPETRTVFYFALGSAAAGGLATLLGDATPWANWTWGHALWLLPVGVLAALGQLCMTRAYASAQRPKAVRCWSPTSSTRASSSLRCTACCSSATGSTLRVGPEWCSSSRAASAPPCCASARCRRRRPRNTDGIRRSTTIAHAAMYGTEPSTAH